MKTFMHKTVGLLFKTIYFLLNIFVILISIVIIGVLFNAVVNTGEDSAFYDFLNFDLTESALLILQIFLMFIFIVAIYAIGYLFIIENILKKEINDYFYFNSLKFIALIHFLLGILLVFNTTQFATVVGLISLAALIWPRIRD